jgi:two-component system, cell cycle sensor histidine kinase and response regulator CckA
MPSDDTKKQPEGPLRDSEIRALGDDRDEAEGHFPQAPVGLYRTLPSGEVLRANNELSQMLGVGSPEELRGVDASKFYVNPDDRHSWRKAIDERGVTQVDSAMRRRDGRVVWFRDIGRVVRDGKGNILWYEGALIDVTAKHRAEVELKRSEERFRRLLESIPDGILRFTKEGVCVDARLGTLGGSLLLEPNPVGERLSTLFARELADELLNAIQNCADRGAVAFEHRVPGSRGSVFYDIVVTPSGREEVLVLIRDVSGVRRMREQLFRGERLAAVGSLAMGVAHEINNPLTAVVVNLDFVRDVLAGCRTELGALLPDDIAAQSFAKMQQASEALDDALQGAHRVADVVREIKTFASAGDERPSSVDISAVLESATRLVNNQIRHRAKLTREFAQAPPVWGNAARLEEVFINLLVNAAQAIEPGRADENEVRVSAMIAPDGRVVVEIADSGSGIRAEDLERIFDPFFTTKPVGTGTGMGLSVSQAIVAGYGGEITAASTPESGTVFRVWLTRAAETFRARLSSRVPKSIIARARIAVIEDEQLGGRALKRVLGAEHDVYVTNTAQSALDLIATGTRFDVILCDVMMPVMTGVEFHKRLTQSYPEQAARVVFITGGAFTEDERRYLEEIENLTLEKPVGAHELTQIISEILANDSTRG